MKKHLLLRKKSKTKALQKPKQTPASSIPEAASTKEDTDRTPASAEKEPVNFDSNKAPEDMSIEELQAGILAKMATNGSVTDQMKKTSLRQYLARFSGQLDQKTSADPYY